MKGTFCFVCIVALLILRCQAILQGRGDYFGKEIGQLSNHAHGVSGTVYAADETTIVITGFSFDGVPPETFLWVGTSDSPSQDGRIVFHSPSKEKLGVYNNAEISASMPPDTKITDFKWISVWCVSAKANFGEVYIPTDFVAPAPHSLGPLPTKHHEVSASSVWILDSRTLLFVNFTYDGEGPDTYFWAGNTSEPNVNGSWLYWSSRRETILPVGRPFTGEDVTVYLPATFNMFDITYVSVWCQELIVDFGSITFDPASFNLPAANVIRSRPHYGKLIGDLVNATSGVAGRVFAVDQSTFLIEDFSYNGLKPYAVLWVGTTDVPSADGIPLYLNDSQQKLEAHTHDTVVVSVGDNIITDYKWLSVWCRLCEVDLGHTMIPADLELPYKTDLGTLPTFAHGVKADKVLVLDSRTVLLVNFFYDGQGPDTFFTAGKTHNPDDYGVKLNFRYGNNQQLPVGTVFNGENVTVTIPDGYSIFDFTYFSVWCFQFTLDFGSVKFSGPELNVPIYLDGDADLVESSSCKVLIEDEFQVRWQILGSDILIWLSGRVAEGEYMAFGLSGSDTRTLMDGSDVTVVWQKKGRASDIEIVDYNLHSKQQCTASGGGACEDTATGGDDNIEDDTFFNSYDGIKEFFFRRKLNTGDTIDKVIPTDREVFISWAIGEINPAGRVAKHTKAPSGDVKINFGMDGSVCPDFKIDTSPPTDVVPWPALRLNNVEEFRVEIGQNGGKRGYQSITGRIGWGVAWYVNELLIPEIYVVRGVKYSFTVFGGEKVGPAIYHPFYITNDTVGGYTQQSEAERKYSKIYAGPHEGPLCSWDQRAPSTSPDDYDSFAAYKEELVQQCENSSSNATTFHWIPNIETPDLVYYQCYTHRYLGWKIHVSDEPVVFTDSPPETTSSAPAFILSVVLLIASPLVGQLLI